MSNTSCSSGHPVKSSKQSGCGTKGASQQIASAEVYATPSAEILRSVIHKNDIVLAYVVRTCKPKHDGSGASVVLEHTGSGPNMAGGRITLCTCKHTMRTSPVFWDDELRSNIWIAGFSSSSFDGKNWLYYLMKVGQKFDSQREIYEYLKASPDVLAKKLATKNERGDIFEPTNFCRNPLDPDDYKNPHANHSHIAGDKWKRDINCQYHGRHPKMLLGDEFNSYCYPNGIIFLNTAKPMTQGNRLMSEGEFLPLLNDVKRDE
jgi:hypothetical protein